MFSMKGRVLGDICTFSRRAPDHPRCAPRVAPWVTQRWLIVSKASSVCSPYGRFGLKRLGIRLERDRWSLARQRALFRHTRLYRGAPRPWECVARFLLGAQRFSQTARNPGHRSERPSLATPLGRARRRPRPYMGRHPYPPLRVLAYRRPRAPLRRLWVGRPPPFLPRRSTPPRASQRWGSPPPPFKGSWFTRPLPRRSPSPGSSSYRSAHHRRLLGSIAGWGRSPSSTDRSALHHLLPPYPHDIRATQR